MGPVLQLPSVATAGMGLAATKAAKKRMMARMEVVARANIVYDVKAGRVQ